MLLLQINLSYKLVNSLCRDKREDLYNSAPRESFRLQSLSPFTIGVHYTTPCNEIVFNNKTLGLAGNWTSYEIVNENELLYLENGTLFHRFVYDNSLDHPLVHSVACFALDRINMRIIWVTLDGELISSDNSTPRINFSCTEMQVVGDSFLVLHTNSTITHNWQKIADHAHSLPLLMPSDTCSFSLLNSQTVIVSSITCSIIIVVRVLLNIGRRLYGHGFASGALGEDDGRRESGHRSILFGIRGNFRSRTVGDTELQATRPLHSPREAGPYHAGGRGGTCKI